MDDLDLLRLRKGPSEHWRLPEGRVRARTVRWRSCVREKGLVNVGFRQNDGLEHAQVDGGAASMKRAKLASASDRRTDKRTHGLVLP